MGAHRRVVEEIGSDRSQELGQACFELVIGGAIRPDLGDCCGIEQTPNDLDAIADLQKFPDLLRKRECGEKDIAAVTHGNWMRSLERGLLRDGGDQQV
jgi:microsomal dipeptidase-like Zn-dependent dipeptidase